MFLSVSGGCVQDSIETANNLLNMNGGKQKGSVAEEYRSSV